MTSWLQSSIESLQLSTHSNQGGQQFSWNFSWLPLPLLSGTSPPLRPRLRHLPTHLCTRSAAGLCPFSSWRRPLEWPHLQATLERCVAGGGWKSTQDLSSASRLCSSFPFSAPLCPWFRVSEFSLPWITRYIVLPAEKSANNGNCAAQTCSLQG